MSDLRSEVNSNQKALDIISKADFESMKDTAEAIVIVAERSDWCSRTLGQNKAYAQKIDDLKAELKQKDNELQLANKKIAARLGV